MMRLPYFAFHAPRSVGEAADLLATHRVDAMLVAGGTDLLPNMKRRQQVPRTLISLRRVAELRRRANGEGVTLGAGLTLTEIVRAPSALARLICAPSASSAGAVSVEETARHFGLDVATQQVSPSFFMQKSIAFRHS